MNVPTVSTSLSEIMAAYLDLSQAAAGRHSVGATIGAALLLAHHGATRRTLSHEEILEMVNEASQWLFGWVSLTSHKAS